MNRILTSLVILLAIPTVAGAQQFEFMAAPHQGLNRVYRVDKITGEVGACQYGLKEGGIGVTICYPAGEGARPLAPAEFGLIASNHLSEAGIFRVNRRSGEISICYVMNDESVVCTPPAK